MSDLRLWEENNELRQEIKRLREQLQLQQCELSSSTTRTAAGASVDDTNTGTTWSHPTIPTSSIPTPIPSTQEQDHFHFHFHSSIPAASPSPSFNTLSYELLIHTMTFLQALDIVRLRDLNSVLYKCSKNPASWQYTTAAYSDLCSIYGSYTSIIQQQHTYFEMCNIRPAIQYLELSTSTTPVLATRLLTACTTIQYLQIEWYHSRTAPSRHNAYAIGRLPYLHTLRIDDARYLGKQDMEEICKSKSIVTLELDEILDYEIAESYDDWIGVIEGIGKISTLRCFKLRKTMSSQGDIDVVIPKLASYTQLQSVAFAVRDWDITSLTQATRLNEIKLRIECNTQYDTETDSFNEQYMRSNLKK